MHRLPEDICQGSHGELGVCAYACVCVCACGCVGVGVGEYKCEY